MRKRAIALLCVAALGLSAFAFVGCDPKEETSKAGKAIAEIYAEYLAQNSEEGPSAGPSRYYSGVRETKLSQYADESKYEVSWLDQGEMSDGWFVVSDKSKGRLGFFSVKEDALKFDFKYKAYNLIGSVKGGEGFETYSGIENYGFKAYYFYEELEKDGAKRYRYYILLPDGTALTVGDSPSSSPVPKFNVEPSITQTARGKWAVTFAVTKNFYDEASDVAEMKTRYVHARVYSDLSFESITDPYTSDEADLVPDTGEAGDSLVNASGALAEKLGLPVGYECGVAAYGDTSVITVNNAEGVTLKSITLSKEYKYLFALDGSVYYYVLRRVSDAAAKKEYNLILDGKKYDYCAYKHDVLTDTVERIDKGKYYFAAVDRKFYAAKGDAAPIGALCSAYEITSDKSLSERAKKLLITDEEVLDASSVDIGKRIVRLSETRYLIEADDETRIVDEELNVVADLGERKLVAVDRDEGYVYLTLDGRCGAVDFDGIITLPFKFKAETLAFGKRFDGVAEVDFYNADGEKVYINLANKSRILAEFGNVRADTVFYTQYLSDFGFYVRRTALEGGHYRFELFTLAGAAQGRVLKSFESAVPDLNACFEVRRLYADGSVFMSTKEIVDGTDKTVYGVYTLTGGDTL